MLRPVVLDMDGVLVDSEPLNEAAFRAYLSSLHRPELSGWFANTLGRREVDFLPELAAELGRPAPEISAALAAELETVLSRAGPDGDAVRLGGDCPAHRRRPHRRACEL
jgi:beta-phosphoglucomutase-like phosphatase (HAD superfamily)